MGSAKQAVTADWIYTGATVWIGDAENRTAAALAVKDGRVLATGSKEAVLRFAGPNTEIEDLRGAFVMPGFLDSHTHAPGTALADLYEVSLYTCKSPDDCLQRAPFYA